jgi:uncharacterized protein
MKALAGLLLIAVSATSSAGLFPTQVSDADAAEGVQLAWGVKIPMRDGVRLNVTVYTPRAQQASAPCIFTLTPYIGQAYHARGVYFAFSAPQQ